MISVEIFKEQLNQQNLYNKLHPWLASPRHCSTLTIDNWPLCNISQDTSTNVETPSHTTFCPPPCSTSDKKENPPKAPVFSSLPIFDLSKNLQTLPTRETAVELQNNRIKNGKKRGHGDDVGRKCANLRILECYQKTDAPYPKDIRPKTLSQHNCLESTDGDCNAANKSHQGLNVHLNKSLNQIQFFLENAWKHKSKSQVFVFFLMPLLQSHS